MNLLLTILKTLLVISLVVSSAILGTLSVKYLIAPTTWDERVNAVGEYLFDKVTDGNTALEPKEEEKIVTCIGTSIVSFLKKEAPKCEAPIKILGVGPRLEECLNLAEKNNQEALSAVFTLCTE